MRQQRTIMARPQLASDDEILQAALAVISRRGPDSFTLSEVAAKVGLSRAAIILRFKSTQALKIKLLTRMVEHFVKSLETLPTSPGGDNLIEVAAFIGGIIPHRANLASFFVVYSGNIKDELLAELERKRGNALSEAVSRVTPKVSIAHDSAVRAFMAHLSGTILDWQALDDTDAKAYMVERTKEWLTLAQIPYGEDRAAGKPRRALEDATGQ